MEPCIRNEETRRMEASESGLASRIEPVENNTGQQVCTLYRQGISVPMVYSQDATPMDMYLSGLPSPNSKRAMRASLEYLAGIASDGRLTASTYPWWTLTANHCEAIRAHLSEGTASTGNLRLAALRGVLKSCWRAGKMSTDAYMRCIDFKRLRGTSLPAGRSLEAGEILALFQECGTDPSQCARRDAAMLAVLVGCGLRRQECVDLALSDYTTETGELRIRRGKGAKARVVWLTNGSRDAMQEWLDVRGLDDGALFHPITKGSTGIIKRRAMSTNAVYAVLLKRAQRAGVKRFSPHDLRRSFASTILEKGGDISHVSGLMGHADISTTQGYDRRPLAARKKTAELLHVPFKSYSQSHTENL